MRIQYTCPGWTLLVAASIFIPGVVQAADSGRQIEEVIVTAERQEASIQDTSISITAFTAQMLDDFGIRNQEDLQNFVPAMTIQPYDATIRGVGRNFRALGGDPGVATYMNGVYSEDLLTATAATFWDVERIEVLRGPQGTLYGRNAVGGAINIIYKQPTEELDYAFKVIGGNFNTEEYYGMVSGPLIDGVLSARFNFSLRDRDGIVEEIGPGDDIDSLGTENIAAQFRFTPSANLEFDVRFNRMELDRSMGGANGAGLVVMNEEGMPSRNTTDLVAGYRAIDTTNTDPANYAQESWYDVTRPVLNFTDPLTGANVQAQHVRAGVDVQDWDGAQNAAASLDGFNNTSAASAAALNNCVFPDAISGDDLCAATNGLNREKFDQQGVQFSAAWDLTDTVQLKYIYGYNKLSYQRTTDDDNTASQIHDLQFYVNHEAKYESHEIQAFFDFSDNLSFTSGIFFYDALIDQRGDYYSAVGEGIRINPYNDVTGLDGIVMSLLPGIITAGNTADLDADGNPVDAATFNGLQPTLHSAKALCQDPATRKAQCAANYATLHPAPAENNNLHIAVWGGDDGTNPDLDVQHGPNTRGSDLLYHTQTDRDSFAAYTQGVWDINDAFTLTFGLRYAKDEVTAEENLFRYAEVAAAFFPAFGIDNFTYNLLNGGVVADAAAPGGYSPTERAVNGGFPAAISVYRPFKRKDTKMTGRINLDWNVNDAIMLYLSATSGYRSGGNTLVYFSATPAYDPEELLAYEFGYKTQMLNDTLQLNGSFYLYDYETIHTFASEVTPPLVAGDDAGTSISILEAPGAEVWGIEAEALWLATDEWTVGGNFSFTPSEYDKDLFMMDTAGIDRPFSLFPTHEGLMVNIKGNQLVQVPEWKYTAWARYRMPLSGGSNVEFFGVYSWIDEVYYSPFESARQRADAYDRTDLRATWTSADGNWIVSGFVNNVFDDVGVLQILMEGEAEFFRRTAGITSPRLMGVELTYSLAN